MIIIFEFSLTYFIDLFLISFKCLSLFLTLSPYLSFLSFSFYLKLFFSPIFSSFLYIFPIYHCFPPNSLNLSLSIYLSHPLLSSFLSFCLSFSFICLLYLSLYSLPISPFSLTLQLSLSFSTPFLSLFLFLAFFFLLSISFLSFYVDSIDTFLTSIPSMFPRGWF